MTKPGRWSDEASDYREIIARIKALELSKPDHEYVDFAPTVTTVTLGTAGTKVARYSRVGNTINYSGKIVLGSGGSFSGSDVTIELPVAAASVLDQLGTCLGIDTGTYRHMGYCFASVGGSALVFRLLPNGTDNSPVTMTGTAPFTWGNTDVLFWQISYECAT